MKIVPTRPLAIGIASALTALWCGYRLIWLIYTLIWLICTATTLSSIGWSPVSLVFPFVLWGVIGVNPAPDETALGDAICGGRFLWLAIRVRPVLPIAR